MLLRHIGSTPRSLVISGLKMGHGGQQSLFFGCRTIQGRPGYKICLSSMLGSGVIVDLSSKFISKKNSAGAFLALVSTQPQLVNLLGVSARLSGR